MQNRKLKRWALAGAIAAAAYGTAALADEAQTKTSTTIQQGQRSSDQAIQQGQNTMNDAADMNQSTTQTSPDYMAPPDYQTNITTQTTTQPEYTKTETRHERMTKKFGGPSSAWNKPLLVTVGGGLEGQTGELSRQLRPGPAWGAAVALQPLPFMGIEGAYSGATANQDTRVSGGNNQGLANGADIVRNGGQGAVTVLAPTPFIQPYALGGVGFDHYQYRGSAPLFQDDTAGRVPLGGGLKANVGNFVADARGQYNILFSDQVSTTAPGRGGTYDVTLNLGARF